LDDDLARIFKTATAVNTALQKLVEAMPQAAKAKQKKSA